MKTETANEVNAPDALLSEARADALRESARTRELDSLRDLRAMVLGVDGAGVPITEKSMHWAWANIVRVAKLSRTHFEAQAETEQEPK